MTQDKRSPIAQDRLQAAVKAFSELTVKHPDRSRRELLERVELEFDLSPLECEFLHRHLSKGQPGSA